MSKPILVVWNCGAGSAEQCADVRREIEADAGVEIFESDDMQRTQRRIRAAVADGTERIVAAGGDGTVSLVGGLMVRGRADRSEFAVLPLGTGNDLARSLGMPLDPGAAWQECLTGRASPMDVLRVKLGGRQLFAMNMVTAGNTGKYAAAITSEMKQRWGPFCYLRGTVDVLQDLQVYQLRFRCAEDAMVQRYEALNVFLANGRSSGGGLTVAPEARLDDGLIDVVLIRDGDALDLAGLTADYVLSDIRENDLVVHRRCRAIRIAGRPPLPLSIDGDAREPHEFSVRVLPGVLRAVRGGEELPGAPPV